VAEHLPHVRVFEGLVGASDMSLLADFVAYMRNGPERRLREDTIRGYTRHLAAYLRRAGAGQAVPVLSLVSKPQLVRVLSQVHHGQVASRRNTIFALKAFARFLADVELLAPDVAQAIAETKFKERARPARPVVPAEQVAGLVRHIATTSHYDDAERATMLAIVGLLAATGLRNSELCQLRLQDVDFEHGVIRVVDGKGGKARTVGLPARAVPVLRLYLQHRPATAHDHFFIGPTGAPLTRELIGKRLGRLSRASGIKVAAHMLRRTFATTVAHKGIPLDKLQVVLGHADIQTTRMYVQTDVHAVAQEMRGW
jgi:site-specific recombinase XerD